MPPQRPARTISMGRFSPHVHCKSAGWTIDIMRMTQALRTATEVVARTLVSALALPSAKQFDGVSAESAGQVLKRELAIPLHKRQVHCDVVRKVEYEPSTEPALQPAEGREGLHASLCGVSLYGMPDILSHACLLQHRKCPTSTLANTSRAFSCRLPGPKRDRLP